MPVRVGTLTSVRSTRGVISYQIEMEHDDLHRVRVIKGSDPDFVRRKAAVQAAEWDEQWAKKESARYRTFTARAALEQREQKKRVAEDQRAFAEERTAEAQESLEGLRNVLHASLERQAAVDWNALRNSKPFPIPAPRKASPPDPPQTSSRPREPLATDVTFMPNIGIIDRLIPSRRRAIEQECASRFADAHAKWVAECAQITKLDVETQEKYRKSVATADEDHRQRVRQWESDKSAYEQQRDAENAAIDRQRELYEAKDLAALVSYFDMVLSRSEYPECCPKEFELDFNFESGVLIVDYSLPSPDAMPRLAEVKYVRGEFVEKEISLAAAARLYDEALYQITLRSVHELFSADTVRVLNLVVFNGYVTSTDRATGNEATACVMSLQAARDEFLAINLASVDPKACFKQLKGVGSSKLHSVAAVPPIMRIRREDGRFIASHDVAYQLDNSYNLAAMDWEEFEHLIREVFEKEFISNGGEVKVTQASRDGGVDAVAFDPDPIRGGKIVIQAKRYTNTVGVAAVRDLYGTLMNEGATKGILVTTSDYGPDAYAFATNKPLTLLNGSNLLHLLEKHGHRAKIDLQEARVLAMGQRSATTSVE